MSGVPPAILGISGARRNAAAAVWANGELLAVCEQERVTRSRGAGLNGGGLPDEAVKTVLELADLRPGDVGECAVAEPDIRSCHEIRTTRLAHHFSHAATAFLTSPFNRAVVLVCDEHSSPPVSLWVGDGDRLDDQHLPWRGPGFAALYSAYAAASGFRRGGDEHQVEALARAGNGFGIERGREIVEWHDGAFRLAPNLAELIEKNLAAMGPADGPLEQFTRGAALASGFQRHLCGPLLEVLQDARSRLLIPDLCLGGGLFYNTYFNTTIAESRIFDRTFVPLNPGNAGLAAGLAMAVAWRRYGRSALSPVAAFLGPGYGLDQTKAVLDNCKLSYNCGTESEILDVTVQALQRGHLVGWFQDRMEWGHRALGHRSILASPLSPYVLDNLNLYLKSRQPYHTYGLSVCEEDAPRYFSGPAASRCMEYEYHVSDPVQFHHVMPLGTTRLRVQTIPSDSAGLFRKLHKAFGEATGIPVLVNTSFNGLHEPIVCSPRDAVRVFYGTGLDLLVIGRFWLRK